MGWPRRRPRDAYPAVMTEQTAADYFDCIGDDGKVRRDWSWWKARPGFPEPRDGRYWKEQLDEFLAEWFGDEEDPIAKSRQELDRMLEDGAQRRAG